MGMLQIALVLTAALAGATWAQAETIDVKYYRKPDLASRRDRFKRNVHDTNCA
jgi:hypothetical protein